MSPNRPEGRKAQPKRGDARKSPPPPTSAKDSRSLEELHRERDAVTESRRIHRAVEAEFEEAQTRGIGVDEMTRRRDVHTSESPVLSGGDVDADWQRADVGDETVGGSVSTPDQDVVDELGEAAGVQFADNEPLDPEEKILRRDRDRWELNPASSERFQENQREQDEELELPPRQATPGRQTKPSPTPTQKAIKAVPSSAKPRGGKNASTRAATGRNTAAKPSAGKKAPMPRRGKQR